MQQPLGVIFIDCWQSIQDQSIWPGHNNEFNFYVNMKKQLNCFNICSKIFHTGTCENRTLALDLVSWQNHENSANIMNIENFQTYYQKLQIFDWIVVGAHWQCCTHDKPLGFHNLLRLKKQDSQLKIYSHMACTVKFLNNNGPLPRVALTEIDDYQNDTLCWKYNESLQELIL
jgi:hypothetical protein